MEPRVRDAGLSQADAACFRATMGSFATGVAIVTTCVDGKPFGMTMNGLTSVSLDPCLLLVCPRRGSATGEAIKLRGAFAVNLLAHGQRDLARRFVGALDGRFDQLALEPCEDDLPLIPGSLARMTCRVQAVHPGGDHDIILGQVRSCDSQPGEPLVFFKGGFGTYAPDRPLDWEEAT